MHTGKDTVWFCGKPDDGDNVVKYAPVSVIKIEGKMMISESL